ncbi:MAG: ribH [Gammaproteobacteria bacterium]|nr:ribH [Gammaproteobacteria bacterium]
MSDQRTLDPAPNIAIVISRFNKVVTDKLLAGAQERFAELVPNDQPLVISVPGAIEIPFIVQKLAKAGGYDAIVALGAVIRGETTHYDYVCDQVSTGCQSVMLQYDLPVIFGVLTTENLAQALDRVGGAHGHKGKDAIDVAFHMISLNRQLS